MCRGCDEAPLRSKRLNAFALSCLVLLTRHLEITPEISVYRFSKQILVDYLKKKVARLVAANDFCESLTVVRLLAKDGLMEDGKEALLEGGPYADIAMRFADTFLAGRLRAACNLIAHHLPPDVKTELMSAYEYVISLLKFG